MFQPTIDSHLLARHIHIQLPLTGAARFDASLGAQVLAHQRSIPQFARTRKALGAVRHPRPSTRPIPASAN